MAGPLTNAPVGVTNGLFTVTLDFGAGVFNGSALTLEIGVRTNGSASAYTVLSPRQPLTSVPYAIQSLNASNAVTLTAPLPATNLAGTIPNSLLSTNVAVLTNNVIFSAGVTATNFTGNGFGLSNLPATSLTGTIPDARLSANVALQSNPNLNFAGAVSATNFTGGGHGLTNVPGAFFWVTVAGTNSQIYPNVGYIATNTHRPRDINAAFISQRRRCVQSRRRGCGRVDYRAKCQSIDPRRKSWRCRRPELADQRAIRLLVRRRVLGRWDQTGGNDQQRPNLYCDQLLYIEQFEHRLDGSGHESILVFCCVLRRWNQARGNGRKQHRTDRTHLYFT